MHLNGYCALVGNKDFHGLGGEAARKAAGAGLDGLLS